MDEARVRELRTEIATMNLGISLEDAERRARDIVATEELDALKANMAAELEAQQVAEKAEADRRWRVFTGEEKPSGPTSEDLLKQAQAAIDANDGKVNW
jgi:hypothetical protein